MRAIGIKSFGGPEVLETMTLDAPEPGPGHVRVKVAFAGVNMIDVHVRRGSFLANPGHPATWPKYLGYEGTGQVEAVGDGVASVRSGERVSWCGTPGSHAESAIVPAWRLVPVPDKVPLDIACALQLDGMMAHALSMSVFPVTAGDTLLIHAAADPASQLLVQIAKAQGAQVIATVAREADVGGPRASGADHVVVLAISDVVARVRELTSGQGCHAVFDAVGRDTISTSLACCRRRGVIVLHAGHSGAVESVRPDDLAAAGSVYLVRPHLADYMQDAAEVRWRMDGLFAACEAEQLRVGVGRILPMDAAREAHIALEAGTAAGKILLQIDG